MHAACAVAVLLEGILPLCTAQLELSMAYSLGAVPIRLNVKPR